MNRIQRQRETNPSEGGQTSSPPSTKSSRRRNENLLESGHIERINKITNETFIKPLVITVKKDRSAKIALKLLFPIICDASKEGLGAAQRQKSEECW